MKYILLYVWLGTHGVGTMTQKNMTLDECNKLKQIVLQFIIDQKKPSDVVVCIRDDSGDNL